MKLIKYDNNELINFYKENGLEFSDKYNYFGVNVKSIALVDKEIIGAISFSNYKNNNYIEAIAIKDKYRNKGYGQNLLKEVLNKLKKPIYLVSKNDKFFLNNGFIYDNFDLIGEECKKCKEYNICCFPKVMVYK